MKRRNNHHFTFQKFSNIFFKNELSFRFDSCLLPNGMLGEKFVGGAESGVMENIRIAFEHVTNSRTQFRKPCIPFLFLLDFQCISVLKRGRGGTFL